MKKFGIIFLAIICTIGLMAQENEQKDDGIKTLVGDKNLQHGGYFGATFAYGQMNNTDALFFGGRGMWVINHGVGIGLGGYGFANEPFMQYDYYDYDDEVALSGGYGGLIIEPIIFPKYPVHVAFPILLGAGGVSTYSYWDEESYYPSYEKAFFIAEPSVELELNVVKFMRISVGGTYRLTTGVHIPNLPQDVLNGFSGNMSLKFGWF